MSTVLLLKDCEHGRKGQAVSVPFGTGRNLLSAGIAAYPEAAAPKPASAPDQSAAIKRIQDEAIAAMQSQEAAHKQEIADLEKTHQVALADLADARKQLAAVTAERDDLAKKAKPK